MLIKELRICNFLVFAGEQRIELPTGGDSNLVLILAPNNTGKTNIIRALKFFFYGHPPDCTEATAYRLTHDGIRTAAPARAEEKLSGAIEVRSIPEANDVYQTKLVKKSVNPQGWDNTTSKPTSLLAKCVMPHHLRQGGQRAVR
jgi:AAA domain